MSLLRDHLNVITDRSRIVGFTRRFIGWYLILYIVSIATDFLLNPLQIIFGDRDFGISVFSSERILNIAVGTVAFIVVLRVNKSTMPQTAAILLSSDKVSSNDEDQKRYREYLNYESKHSSATRTLSNRIRTLIAIDGRISVLRTRAGLMLISIGLLLVASILVIIFAGSLTSLDVSAVNDIDKLDTVINNLESKVTLISNVHDLLAEREAAQQAQQSDRAQAAQKKLDGLLQSSSYDGVPRALPEVNELLSTEYARIDDFKSLLKEAWEKPLMDTAIQNI
jgi:hypothetical protein